MEEKDSLKGTEKMSLAKKNIPNIITSSRIFLSLVLALLIYIYPASGLTDGQHAMLILCFGLILLSDVLDGHVARKMNLATNFGAKLDLVADMAYVTGTTGVLVYFERLPAWYLVAICFGFAQFIVTSKILALYCKSQPLVFDRMGRTAGILTMLLPGIFVFGHLMVYDELVLKIGTLVITGMFCTSTLHRAVLLYRFLNKKNETLVSAGDE